ncbi:MAG TPA: DUF3619 family protein [Oxalicibacterium sp.]|jgi:hypothetical protein|nr:DUF3619 family protein [Oxalicibacterium sp.]
MNTKELAFAYKVRHALDENVQDIPASTSERLLNARKLALSRKKQHVAEHAVAPRAALSGTSSSFFSEHPVGAWLGRVSSVIPLIVLVLGLVSLHQAEKRQQLMEAASIDAEVLTDELPLSAYLDHGFDAYLAKEAN